MIFTASTFAKANVKLAKEIFCHSDAGKTIGKNTFQKLVTQDVKLMGRKDVTQAGDFHQWYHKSNTPVSFSMSMKKKDELNMGSFS